MNLNLEAGADANREYKDSVFTLLFGTDEAAVELSNTVLGTNYGPDTKVEFTTIKNVLCKGRFNDLSFVLDGKLVVLIEHQSTVNQNMPLRMLLYIAEIYNRLFEDEDLYSQKMFSIPRPEFIVLYNGIEDMPDKLVLKLSDMFKDVKEIGNPANLELTVTVYNINKGRNPEMAKRSPTLDGYATFIFMVQENKKTMSFKDAVKNAVLECIKQNILKTFLQKHKREVIGMLLHEWKLEEAVAVAKREAKEDGRREQAIQFARKMKNKGFSLNDIAEMTELSIDDILRL